MGPEVSLDFTLKSSIEDVWFALTDPATLEKWMMFKPVGFKAEVGHEFKLESAVEGWGGVVDCKILEVDEPHRLVYTWVTGEDAGIPVNTTVTWTLEEHDGGTALHIEQAGFPAEAKQAIQGAGYGWQNMIGQLQELLAD